MRSIELFSGCGGLALGTARAGFNHELMVEWNADAFATLALNKANGVEHARDWPFIREDVRQVD
jgi:DNA (cytosine-5)-methyltransferase 1